MTAIFCAVDTADMDRAAYLAEIVADAGAGLKLGLEFFNAHGPHGIRNLRDRFPDLPFFLDLKLHDIPNTVAAAVRSLVPLRPDYLNVHASGGAAMMRAAVEAADTETQRLGLSAMRMIAVTVLTSLDDDEIIEIGWMDGAENQVLRLSILARDAGMAGVVCSPQEIAPIRKHIGNDFVLITPGIRPADAASTDQKRVMTPAEAMAQGATHLVIGRPITAAPDPAVRLAEIQQSLSTAPAR